MNSKRIAIAIIRRGTTVLTGIRSANVVLGGYDEFPGGKCEPGESPQEAVVREVLEETGLDVRASAEFLVVNHEYDHGKLELHFWTCELNGESEAKSPDAPFRWTQLSDLTNLNFPDANLEVVNMLSAQSQPTTGIIIVDHGSRRAASNEMLLVAANNFASQSEYDIVEPAHMELADPDIATAFARCVERGAKRVIIFPYFLSPGRHWSQDIPNLAKEAARPFPDVTWLVTAPFGLHPGISGIISDRINHCLEAAQSQEGTCDACDSGTRCQFRAESAPD